MTATLSITSSIDTGEGSNSAEMITEGDFCYASGVISIAYDETQLTAMEGTRTCFRIMDDYVLMTRSGTVSSSVLFRPGEYHYFHYDTPFGSMQMGVETQSVTNHLGIHGGELDLRYAINVQGTPISRNEVSIKVTGLH